MMGEGSNELYNKQDELQATGINSGVEHSSDIEKKDFSDVEEVLPGYSGNNTELLNDFLKSNPDLKGLLNDFLKNENIALKDKILCKKNIRNCKTVDDIKSLIIALTPGGYKIGKKEEVQKIVEDKGIDTEQAKTETEQAEINKNKTESIEIRNKAIEARDQLVAKYQEQNLDAKTNANSETYQSVKNQLENNGTLNQLRQNHDEQFINDYILVQSTLAELKSNPILYEKEDISYFDKIVKNLDNACNIPDTSLSSFSTENIAQTRTELFNEDIGNESLIQARNNNVESHAEAYAEIFPEMGTDEVIAKYGKFLQGDLKTFWQQYETNRDVIKNKINNIRFKIVGNQINQFDENGKNYITDEEKVLVNNYDKMYAAILGTEVNGFKDGIQYNVENQTKNLMEEMCIISQIKGMYMCIGQEEGEDFNLNKANEIINDNGVLTLKGHIDGVDFSVRHDTINPNQRLKIKSKLGVDSEDQNTFEIGKENNYVNSPFILPSQEEIFGVITKVVQSNDLSKSSDLPKYLEGLQNSIIGRMDEVYRDAELAHHYVTNKVKGEKIVDNSLAMIQGIKPNMQDLTKPINQSSNPKLHSFMKMIKFNVENSTTEEKNKLNQCMARILEN